MNDVEAHEYEMLLLKCSRRMKESEYWENAANMLSRVCYRQDFHPSDKQLKWICRLREQVDTPVGTWSTTDLTESSISMLFLAAEVAHKSRRGDKPSNMLARMIFHLEDWPIETATVSRSQFLAFIKAHWDMNASEYGAANAIWSNALQSARRNVVHV